MVSLVYGNAKDLYNAFGLEWITAENTDLSLSKDLPRSMFLGTEAQAKHLVNTWTKAEGRFYAQGNITAENLKLILGHFPFIKKEEETNHQEYQDQFVCDGFAYVNETQELCGLMFMYRKDDPRQWMIGLMKNNHLLPEQRTVAVLSGADLESYIHEPQPKITVSNTNSLKNQLMDQIDSPFILAWLQSVIKMDTGTIHTHCGRLSYLLRIIKVQNQNGKLLQDPVNLSEYDPQLLLAENPALDLINQHGLTLSSAMLKDCLTLKNGLRQEIEAIVLSDDDKVNRNILEMVIVFYEQQILSANRPFLNKEVFTKTSAGTLWNDDQINLIPFLVKNKYSSELFNLVLSEEAYYNSVQLLVELGYTEDIPEFLANPLKLKELEFIYSLSDVTTRKLCLIFWTKDELTSNEYNEIVKATLKYPMLAEALVALDLDKADTTSIKKLRKIALTPSLHLPVSISYHFKTQFERSGLKKSDLKVLNTAELIKLSKSLNVLKQAETKEVELYIMAVKNDSHGQLLRLFLPELDKIENDTYRKELIDILYIGVKERPALREKEIQKIKDPELLVLAQNLKERFVCVKQIQNLNFDDAIIALAADLGVKGRRFRTIIMQVEEQCKVVHKTLRGSDSPRAKQWQTADLGYRQMLYSLAFDGITKTNFDIKPRIHEIELNILQIVDPEIKSWFYTALIGIANILITVLTLGRANDLKERRTGNYWFFNQTRLGEQIRALDKEIVAVINSPELDPALLL